MKKGPLGDQTVTVFGRERVAQRGHQDTGETVVWSKCAFEPLDDGAESGTERRQGQTRRWRIFAPAGCRAPATAQVTVSPGGPVDAQGQPLRLDLVGGTAAHPGRRGEDHVTATVHLITTGGDR